MPKVICTLPNASTLINGVKFIEHELGVVSEEISEEVAEVFASIKGYFVHGDKPAAPVAPGESIDELRAKASALNIQFKGNWGASRLKAEIEKAEQTRADSAPASTRLPENTLPGTTNPAEGARADGKTSEEA